VAVNLQNKQLGHLFILRSCSGCQRHAGRLATNPCCIAVWAVVDDKQRSIKPQPTVAPPCRSLRLNHQAIWETRNASRSNIGLAISGGSAARIKVCRPPFDS